MSIVNSEIPAIEGLRRGLSAPTRQLLKRMLSRDPERRPTPTNLLLEINDIRSGQGLASQNRQWFDLGNPGDLVGNWILQELDFEVENWIGFTVIHRETGMEARISRLQNNASLPYDAILESAALAASWSFPGILKVLDWGTWNERPYVTLESAGKSLADIVKESGPLSEIETIKLGITIAKAIQNVHEKGYVYQMTDPARVYADNTLKHFKLGWPCYCQEIGKPSNTVRFYIREWAAPEVYNWGCPFDTATDVFGLGSLLFFALTGESPIKAPEDLKDWSNSSKKGIPSPRTAGGTLTAPLDVLIRKMGAPNGEKRPSLEHCISQLSKFLIQLGGERDG